MTVVHRDISLLLDSNAQVSFLKIRTMGRMVHCDVLVCRFIASVKIWRKVFSEDQNVTVRTAFAIIHKY